MNHSFFIKFVANLLWRPHSNSPLITFRVLNIILNSVLGTILGAFETLRDIRTKCSCTLSVRPCVSNNSSTPRARCGSVCMGSLNNHLLRRPISQQILPVNFHILNYSFNASNHLLWRLRSQQPMPAMATLFVTKCGHDSARRLVRFEVRTCTLRANQPPDHRMRNRRHFSQSHAFPFFHLAAAISASVIVCFAS